MSMADELISVCQKCWLMNYFRIKLWVWFLLDNSTISSSFYGIQNPLWWLDNNKLNTSRGGWRELSPSTKTVLPGDGRGNFVSWIWIDGLDLYNARKLEILDINRILKNAPFKPFSVRTLSDCCSICSAHCSNSYILWRSECKYLCGRKQNFNCG